MQLQVRDEEMGGWLVLMSETSQRCPSVPKMNPYILIGLLLIYGGVVGCQLSESCYLALHIYSKYTILYTLCFYYDMDIKIKLLLSLVPTWLYLLLPFSMEVLFSTLLGESIVYSPLFCILYIGHLLSCKTLLFFSRL